MTLSWSQVVKSPPMRISAKADYAVRAALELASSPDGKPVKGDQAGRGAGDPAPVPRAHPPRLKRAGLIRTKRGARGGYWLAEDPAKVSVADVIRAVEGPLANIQDLPPEETHYVGAAERLRDVWIAVRQNLRVVLENVTLEELASGELPPAHQLADRRTRAWVVRETGTTTWSLSIRSGTIAGRFGRFGREGRQSTRSPDPDGPRSHPRPHHGPAIVAFGFGIGLLVGHDRHGRRLADDAAADPDLRGPAGDGDRHRHLLRGGHQDLRRFSAPPPAPSTRDSPSGWPSAASRPRSPASG